MYINRFMSQIATILQSNSSETSLFAHKYPTRCKDLDLGQMCIMLMEKD